MLRPLKRILKHIFYYVIQKCFALKFEVLNSQISIKHKMAEGDPLLLSAYYFLFLLFVFFYFSELYKAC